MMERYGYTKEQLRQYEESQIRKQNLEALGAAWINNHINLDEKCMSEFLNEAIKVRLDSGAVAPGLTL